MSVFFYTEKQKYQRLWLWIIVFDIIVCGTIVLAVTYHTENKEGLYIAIPILVLAFAFVIWVVASSYIEIKIDKYGVH